MNKGLLAGILVLIIIIVIVAFTYHGNVTTTTTTSTSLAAVPISLTDPAQVPANTTNLSITYSSFSVVYTYTNSSGGVKTVNSTGNIDLLSLFNVSKVLAEVNLPVNSSVKLIGFNVVSASAVINGTLYNVTVPSSIITANLASNRINSSSDLVLDFAPALITVYTAGSVQYVLLPSLTAVSTTGIIHKTIGSISHIPANINRSLFAERANITITSAILSQKGNLTDVTVTVKDNSNKSVILQNLRLKMSNGMLISTLNHTQYLFNNSHKYSNKYNYSQSYNYSRGYLSKYLLNYSRNQSNIISGLPKFMGNLNKSLYSKLNGMNISISGGLRGNIHGGLAGFGNIGRKIQQQFNNTEISIMNNIKANQNRLNIMRKIMYGMSINFLISANGTMFLPFSGNGLKNLPLNVSSVSINNINSSDFNLTYNNSRFSKYVVNDSNFAMPNNFGYPISPGGSVTLTFVGNMNVGEGLVTLELLSGVQYTLYLSGTNGARAVYSVNATN